MGILERALVESTIPAQDLERAKVFYAEKLGLTPISEERIGISQPAAAPEVRTA